MLTARDLADHLPRTAILALPQSALLSATTDRLRRSGWRVFRADTSDALRDLSGQLEPEVVVLPTDGPDESGWLTCAKLLEETPGLRVLVVGSATADGTGFARFVGATLVPGGATAEELADHVEGAMMQSA